MSRINELREPVRSIAEKFTHRGFSLTDITSVGLLLIKDWDANKLADYIELINESGKDADSIVAAAEDDASKLKRKKHPPNQESS